MQHPFLQRSLLVLLLGGPSALLAQPVTIYNDSKETLTFKGEVEEFKATFELFHGKDLASKADLGNGSSYEYPVPTGGSMRISKHADGNMHGHFIRILNPGGHRVAKLSYTDSMEQVMEPDPRVQKGMGWSLLPETRLRVFRYNTGVAQGYQVTESKSFDEIHVLTDGAPALHPPGGAPLIPSVESKDGLKPDELAG